MLNRHGKSTDENGMVIMGMLWKAFSRQRMALVNARRWIQNVADERKWKKVICTNRRCEGPFWCPCQDKNWPTKERRTKWVTLWSGFNTSAPSGFLWIL